MINILIVDDSITETQILKKIFESERDFRVVACAKNGLEAVEYNKKYKPNVITMDIQMPIMDGIRAIHEIMSYQPVPIVVISSKLDSEMKTAFLALEEGALSVLEKPTNITAKGFEYARKRIATTVRSMAEIKVIKRRFYVKKPPVKSLPEPRLDTTQPFEIIAIGASVGGPQALKTILSVIPTDFPLPIVIVQHMTAGYMSGFVKWLNENVAIHVKEACHNEVLQGGIVYFAPDLHHLEINRSKGKLIFKLSSGAPISGFCPSINALLHSVAKSCTRHSIGVLLTGMGSDGADGLLAIKKLQGHTIIQDEESAVVFGMAGVAQSMGAVDKIVEMDKIADYLLAIVKASD